MKKRIVVLGSTGSIGRQVLEVVRAMPGKFEILALCAGSDAGLLRQQALEFRPQWLGLADPEEAADLAGLGARVEAGPEAASLLAALPQGGHGGERGQRLCRAGAFAGGPSGGQDRGIGQ